MAGQHHIYHWKHGWIPLTHAAAMSKAKGNSKLADKFVPGASHHHDSRIATHGMSAAQIHATLAPHKHHSDAAAVAKLRDGDHALVHGMDEHGHATSFAGTVHGTPTVVRIKQGQNGKVEHHLAVPMHNGSDRSGGDASARTTVYVKNPDGTTPAQASKSRLAIRAGSYRGEQGHHITGTNKGRTGQRVFVPGDRKDAETVKANMLAGKDRIFEGAGGDRPRGGESLHDRLDRHKAEGEAARANLTPGQTVKVAEGTHWHKIGMTGGELVKVGRTKAHIRHANGVTYQVDLRHVTPVEQKAKRPSFTDAFTPDKPGEREARDARITASVQASQREHHAAAQGKAADEQSKLDKLAGERTKFYDSANGGKFTLHRNHPLAPAGTVGVETASGGYVGHMKPVGNGRVMVTPHSAPDKAHDVRDRGQALAALHVFHQQDLDKRIAEKRVADRARQLEADRVSGRHAQAEKEASLIRRIATLRDVRTSTIDKEMHAKGIPYADHEARMAHLTEAHATALAAERRARARQLASSGNGLNLKMTPPKVSRTVNDTPTMQANRGKIGATLTAEPVPFHGDHPLREGQRVTVTHNGEKLEGHVIHAGGGTRGMAYFPTAKLYYDGNRFWTGQQMKDHVIADRKRHAANFTRGR